VIAISSSAKRSNRNVVAAHLVRELNVDFGLKVSADYHVPPLICDFETVSRRGSDTGVLVEAGAGKVIWASSPTAGGLADVISKALELFGEEGLLLVEGNRALDYIAVNFSVFLMTVPWWDFKPSAIPALEKADVVLIDRSEGLKDSDPRKLGPDIQGLARRARLFFYRDETGRAEALGETVRLAREALHRA
jgi:hypothetical protein